MAQVQQSATPAGYRAKGVHSALSQKPSLEALMTPYPCRYP